MQLRHSKPCRAVPCPAPSRAAEPPSAAVPPGLGKLRYGPKMSQTCPKSVPSMCVCSVLYWFINVYHSFIPIKKGSYASNFVHLKPIRTGIAHPLDLSAVTAGILQYGPMDVGKRPKHIIFHEAVKSLCYSYPAMKRMVTSPCFWQ